MATSPTERCLDSSTAAKSSMQKSKVLENYVIVMLIAIKIITLCEWKEFVQLPSML